MTRIVAVRTDSFVPDRMLSGALAQGTLAILQDADNYDPVMDPEVMLCGANPSGVKAVARILPAAPRLRWIHTFSVGIENLLRTELLRREDLAFTNNRGAFDLSIAEHAVACMFAAAKRLPEDLTLQRRHEWRRLDQIELQGASVVIVGFGSIGGEVARLALALGMRVIGIRRHPELGARGQVTVVGIQALPDVTAEADYLVVAAPLTASTQGVISADIIARLKPSAWVINVARGPLIDEDALYAACRDGRIGGAALDVWWQEPLSTDSRWWDLPNVIATPHVSGSARRSLAERSLATFLENLARFERGAPLLNLVDRREGY